jgi:hypothetical protein
VTIDEQEGRGSGHWAIAELSGPRTVPFCPWAFRCKTNPRSIKGRLTVVTAERGRYPLLDDFDALGQLFVP